jgi:hypothetical protein
MIALVTMGRAGGGAFWRVIVTTLIDLGENVSVESRQDACKLMSTMVILIHR